MENNSFKDWTESEIIYAVQQRDRGMSYALIAVDLGRTKDAVRRKIYKHQVETKRIGRRIIAAAVIVAVALATFIFGGV